MTQGLNAKLLCCSRRSVGESVVRHTGQEERSYRQVPKAQATPLTVLAGPPEMPEYSSSKAKMLEAMELGGWEWIIPGLLLKPPCRSALKGLSPNPPSKMLSIIGNPASESRWGGLGGDVEALVSKMTVPCAKNGQILSLLLRGSLRGSLLG
jgi:hypothetical protein